VDARSDGLGDEIRCSTLHDARSILRRCYHLAMMDVVRASVREDRFIQSAQLKPLYFLAMMVFIGTSARALVSVRTICAHANGPLNLK
jgi:hypothetical protein